MSFTNTLGALALVIAAASCDPGSGTVAQGGPCSDEQLAPITASAKAATTRESFYAAVRGAYPELATIASAATDAKVVVAAPTEKLACLTVAAEASMIQSYLPAHERGGAAAANATPPALAAQTAANEAVEICRSADDPRRCAVVHIIALAALSQDAASRLSDAVDDSASTATVGGWRAAEAQADALAEGAASWSAVISSAQRGLSTDLARDYFEPIACSAYADGGALRMRPTSGAADEEAAATDFARAYLTAMTRAAQGLSLTPTASLASSCATEPDGVACGEAHVEAVLTMCEGFWGIRPGG